MSRRLDSSSFVPSFKGGVATLIALVVLVASVTGVAPVMTVRSAGASGAGGIAIPPPGAIDTVAGGKEPCDSSPATTQSIAMSGVVADTFGNLYVADGLHHVVCRIDAATGAVTRFAGTGNAGFSGDGGPATSADLDFPTDVALDFSGNLYISDPSWGRVRRVDFQSGTITTVAGGGTAHYPDIEGESATGVSLDSAQSIAVDDLGSLYIADRVNRVVLRVDGATHQVTVYAGGGSNLGDGGLASNASITPDDVTVDGGGNLYIVETTGMKVRRVDADTQVISTVAGGGSGGLGDGGLATAAKLNYPYAAASDDSGNLYIADYGNNRLRRVDASTGIIATVAGTGTQGFSGDGGPATAAKISPKNVAVDGSGNFSIVGGDRLRRVAAATGVISTIAGNGETSFSGDGGSATLAELSRLKRTAVDAAGNVFIADTDNQRIRKVNSGTGVITTVAGTGIRGFSGDGGPATSARLSYPEGLAVDASGNLYIADAGNSRIRRVDASNGIISTLAGTGTPGFSGDGGQATAAQLTYPSGVTVDMAGDLYIADTGNHRVRFVDVSTGTISTLAGTGIAGFSGDDGQSELAQISSPRDVKVDGSYRVYISDSGNNRIRKIAPSTGKISTFAGSDDPGWYGIGDGGPADEAVLKGPVGLALDGDGNVYIADRSNHRIRMVDVSSGVITTLVGTGTEQFSGDGGPAILASLASPEGVAVDESGNVFIADTLNHRVRVVASQSNATTGFLRVTTSPGLPSVIRVDGHVADQWGVNWVKLQQGSHEVCFGDVAGFVTPQCETAFILRGETTSVNGVFTRAGNLRVVTSPAVPSTIRIDGNPADDWGVWTDIAPGSHQVCFGSVAGFTAPACQVVDVIAGASSVVTGVFTASPGAPGPSGHGLLRVTTSPGVPSVISVDGHVADQWGLNWLKLSPGSHEVCFGDVAGYVTPDCDTVTVTAGQTTTTTGAFAQAGSLRVVTSPAVPSTIRIDGNPADDWGVWTDIAPGSHQVCFGSVAGYTTPACQTAMVDPGATVTITGMFN